MRTFWPRKKPCRRRIASARPKPRPPLSAKNNGKSGRRRWTKNCARKKNQITLRLTGVERQRLQSEETLHTRTLDLEQRLAEKTGLVKNLQGQLSRAVSDHEHLEKKMASAEAHLARADQQLKARETEFQSFKSVAQKELAAAQETHQRKLLELQGQRLTLGNGSEAWASSDALQQTETEKRRLADLRASLEERLHARTPRRIRPRWTRCQKERAALEETHQQKLHSLEEGLDPPKPTPCRRSNTG